MKIQEVTRESLVGKQVEFNAQELIVLSTFVETIQKVIDPEFKGNITPTRLSEDVLSKTIELLEKVIVLLTPIVVNVEGLEATARSLFTAPVKEVPVDKYL